MKTKTLILTFCIIMNCVKALAAQNGFTISSKTIKESILERRPLQEKNKPAQIVIKANASVSTKINVSQKTSFVGKRLVKNKINPRICFSVLNSVSSKELSYSEKNIHIKKLSIIYLGHFIAPAANVLLLLF